MVHLYGAGTARILGPVWSAALVDAIALGPLLSITLNVCLRTDYLAIRKPANRYAQFGPVAATAVLLVVVDKAVSRILPEVIGLNIVCTRMGLMLVAVLVSALIFPSRLLFFVALLFLHSLSLNPHVSTPSATATRDALLASSGFSLIARHESLTGYVSVLENRKDGFRVMRCDHSLLGGQWIHGIGKWPGGEAYKGEMGRVAEPIYVIFVMLEAVRLVHGMPGGDSSKVVRPIVPDHEARALVMYAILMLSAAPLTVNISGLGIGTTPTALAIHGIDTTVIEIDPTVVSFAQAHFDLHPNCSVVVEDAVTFVSRAANVPTPATYDYIIHDVFTGGAEPAPLFTLEFLRSLANLLTDGGVLALNYASDLRLPSAALVFRTARAVFPSCRLFREEAPPEEPNPAEDFANTVLFCRKEPGRFEFREPEEEDFLGSGARKMALKPQWEVDLEPFIAGEGILRDGQTKELEKWGRKGAEGHWWVMRKVLPHEVWETW